MCTVAATTTPAARELLSVGVPEIVVVAELLAGVTVGALAALAGAVVVAAALADVLAGFAGFEVAVALAVFVAVAVVVAVVVVVAVASAVSVWVTVAVRVPVTSVDTPGAGALEASPEATGDDSDRDGVLGPDAVTLGGANGPGGDTLPVRVTVGEVVGCVTEPVG